MKIKGSLTRVRRLNVIYRKTVNYRPQQKNPQQEGIISDGSQEGCIYCISYKKSTIPETHPMRSCHHPELFSFGLHSKQPFPTSSSVINNIPLLCLLNLPMVFVIACLAQIAILCYSQINSFCW